jgi:hypothetical protein
MASHFDFQDQKIMSPTNGVSKPMMNLLEFECQLQLLNLAWVSLDKSLIDQPLSKLVLALLYLSS